jgi:hypothetical protein
MSVLINHNLVYALSLCFAMPANELSQSQQKMSEQAPHQHRRSRYIVMRCQHASITYICSDESQREHTNNATAPEQRDVNIGDVREDVVLTSGLR